MSGLLIDIDPRLLAELPADRTPLPLPEHDLAERIEFWLCQIGQPPKKRLPHRIVIVQYFSVVSVVFVLRKPLGCVQGRPQNAVVKVIGAELRTAFCRNIDIFDDDGQELLLVEIARVDRRHRVAKTLHIAQGVDQLVKQNLVSRLASSRA